jgi:hypothetical protein
MLEARAILFGRLGEHKAALSIYVYDLQNYQRAEECVLYLDPEKPGSNY